MPQYRKRSEWRRWHGTRQTNRIFPLMLRETTTEKAGVAHPTEPGTPQANVLVTTNEALEAHGAGSSERRGRLGLGGTEEDGGVELATVEEETGRLPTPEAWSPSRVETTATETTQPEEMTVTRVMTVEAAHLQTSTAEVSDSLEVKSLSAVDPASTLATPRDE